MSDLAQEVIAIIRNRAGKKQGSIESSDKLQDLGLESLSAVDMVFDLEEKFDIQIPFNVNKPGIADFETVGDVVRAIENLVAKKS